MEEGKGEGGEETPPELPQKAAELKLSIISLVGLLRS